LQVECRTVLRRLLQAGVSEADRRDVERRLDAALEEVTIKPLDEEVAAIVRDTAELGGCRALDAAHLATALYFRDRGDADLILCTFDVRMAEIAARVGLRAAGA
jgi:predicted nucleic acid-binding protein